MNEIVDSGTPSLGGFRREKTAKKKEKQKKTNT